MVYQTALSSGRTLRLRSATSLLCAYSLAETACYRNAKEAFATPCPQTCAHKLHTLTKLRHTVPIALHQVRWTQLSAPGTDLNQVKQTKCKRFTNCRKLQLTEGGFLVESLLVGRLMAVICVQTEVLLPVCSCILLWNATEILQ